MSYNPTGAEKTRCENQRRIIREMLSDGEKHSLIEIMRACDVKNGSAQVTARIRDLRKVKYGNFAIKCTKNKILSKTLGRGIHDYRMLVGVQGTSMIPLSERLSAENERLRDLLSRAHIAMVSAQIERDLRDDIRAQLKFD